MIVELDESNYYIETARGLKLIEFYTTWCMYCKRQRIEFEDLDESDIWIGIIDADESPNLVKQFRIEGYPSFVLLKDGIEVVKFSGFHTKQQLFSKLMNYIK